MPKRLKELTEKEFNNIKASLRHDIFQPPVTYGGEFDHFDGHVDRGGFGFDLLDEMLKYLDGTKDLMDKIKVFYHNLVLPKEDHRKILTVKYFANTTSLKPPTLEEAKRTWEKQHVPPDAMALLEREFKITKELEKVDSQEREELVKEGGYFSTDPSGFKLKDPDKYKDPIQVPQQIKDIIRKRKEDVAGFVDTPIEYAPHSSLVNITRSSLAAESGDTHHHKRAYSMAPRASFSLVPGA